MYRDYMTLIYSLLAAAAAARCQNFSKLDDFFVFAAAAAACCSKSAQNLQFRHSKDKGGTSAPQILKKFLDKSCNPVVHRLY